MMTPLTPGASSSAALVVSCVLLLAGSVAHAQITIPADVDATLTAEGRQALQSMVRGANNAVTTLTNVHTSMLSLEPTSDPSAIASAAQVVAAAWVRPCRALVNGISTLRQTVDTWSTGGNTSASDFSLALSAEFEATAALAPALEAYVALRCLGHIMQREVAGAESCIARLRQMVGSVNRFASEVHRVIEAGADASDADLRQVAGALRVATHCVPVFENTARSVTGFLENNPLAGASERWVTSAETCEANAPSFTYLTGVSTLLDTTMTNVRAFQSDLETAADDLEEAWAPLLDGDIFEGIQDYDIGSVAELKEWFEEVNTDLQAMARGR